MASEHVCLLLLFAISGLSAGVLAIHRDQQGSISKHVGRLWILKKLASLTVDVSNLALC